VPGGSSHHPEEGEAVTTPAPIDRVNSGTAIAEGITAASKSLQIEYRPLESLIPFVRNPRAHSEEQIAQITASIKGFGFTNPILLNGENSVIAGHGRLAAALSLGIEMIPCIELGYLTSAQQTGSANTSS
jgi:hypothetical protein